MDKKKLNELFNEVLDRFREAESYCIHDFYCEDEDGYSHEDLNKDIENYKKQFEKALND